VVTREASRDWFDQLIFALFESSDIYADAAASD
jgi:hypothetical protein